MSSKSKRVVVIGGGIVGISIAESLARRDVQVSVLEAHTVGSRTTSTSFGWVNANGKEPEGYFQINRAGMRAHQAMAEASSSAPWYCPTGHVEVATEQTHEQHLRSRVEALSKRGYSVEELSASQVRRLEPGLNIPGTLRSSVLFAEEAHIFPQLYVAEKLIQLKAAGGKVVEGASVCGFDSASEGVVVRTENGESYPADRAVVAAGRETDHVVRLAGSAVPLMDFTEPGDATVGFLARTNPLPVKLSRLVTTSGLNARPDGGGRLLLQALDVDATADPWHVPRMDSVIAEEFLDRLQHTFWGSNGAEIKELKVGQRVMPADGKTIASEVPENEWMYAVATHSGVTLAPYLGEAVAQEILGTPDPLLKSFRLARFDEASSEATLRAPRNPGEQ